MVVLAGAATACVVPQDLSVAGGPNNRPRLVGERTFPTLGETITVQQTPSGKTPEPFVFIVTINDPDEQTVFIRLFLNGDYTRPLSLPPTRDRAAGSGLRALPFEVSGLCDELVGHVVGRYELELYVSDSGFVGAGDDLRVPQPGGLTTNGYWRLNCTGPLPGIGDAGP